MDKSKIANLADGKLSAGVDIAQIFVNICQDEVQNQHWKAAQLTSHPISMRFRVEGNVQFCCL